MTTMQTGGASVYLPGVENRQAEDPARRITKRAFWSRFPATKETVMRAVRLGAPAGALMLVGALDRLNSRVESSPYVDLDDPETTGGLQWLASVQCPETVALDGQALPLRLTAAERDAVLLAPILAHEAFGVR